MSLFEIIGVITGATCVWLTAKQHIANWPIGILSTLAYAYVFYQVKLYPDMGLQGVYLGLSIYGWVHWARGHKTTPLPVTQLKAAHYPLVAGAIIGGATLMGIFFYRYTDSSLPFLDSFTTALSLAAQFLLSRKVLQNWLLWITADVLYIGMYWYKELYLTAGLYALFLLLCIKGYRAWKQTLKSDSSLGNSLPCTVAINT